MEWSVSGNYRALHHWLQCHQVVTCPVWSANNVSCHQHLGSESCQQWMFWSLYPEQQRGIVWECYSCRAVEIALKLTILASHQCSADPYLTQTSLRKSPSQDIIAWYGIKAQWARSYCSWYTEWWELLLSWPNEWKLEEPAVNVSLLVWCSLTWIVMNVCHWTWHTDTTQSLTFHCFLTSFSSLLTLHSRGCSFSRPTQSSCPRLRWSPRDE